MIYIVEKNVYCEGAYTVAYLKHDEKQDFQALRTEFFRWDNTRPNGIEIQEFVEWLIREKGFKRLEQDEYEFFHFED